MRILRTGTFGLLLAVACGCASRGNVELLESRLRLHEDTLASLRSELGSARADVRAARREADSLRSQLAGTGREVLLPEQAQALHRVTGVTIPRLLTGGLNRDDRPGDDELNVVLVPHDEHGEPVKLPGAVRFELFDLARDGVKRRLGTWEFPVEETRNRWQAGFLASGYQFRLPWQTVPGGEELLLHARLATADGRQFDASSPVRIRPPSASAVRAASRSRRDESPAAAEFQLPDRPSAASTRAGQGEPSPPLEFRAPGAVERIGPAERTDTSDARRDWEFPVLR